MVASHMAGSAGGSGAARDDLGAALLARYRAGDIGAWDELCKQGPLRRDTPLYAAALQIARELMARVERNLRCLNVRLIANGLAFAWLDPIEPADAEAAARIVELERLCGPLPPSLRAWHERFYHVHLQGSYDGWVSSLSRTPQARAVPRDDHCFGDALSVASIDQLLAAARAIRQTVSAGVGASVQESWRLPLGPGLTAKEGLDRAPYVVLLPSGGADATVLTHRRCSFVEHLRDCMRWCGFYGFSELDRPPEVVARVLPFLEPF